MNNAFTIILVAFPAYLLFNGKLTKYFQLAGTSQSGATASQSVVGALGAAASDLVTGSPAQRVQSLLNGMGAALTSDSSTGGIGGVTN